MCRNLRVKRELVKWRQEGNSYFSIVPADIIAFTLQFISPDIWKELFLVEKLWSKDRGLDTNRPSSYPLVNILSDLSVVIGFTLQTPQIINRHGETTVCSDVILPHWTSLPSDFQGGFYYYRDGSDEKLTICHYSQVEKRVTETYSYQKLEKPWSAINFTMTEEKVCYVTYHGDRMDSTMLVRYVTEQPDLILKVKGLFHDIKYCDRKLYLSHYLQRIEIAHPEELTADSVLQPTLNLQINENKYDYLGEDGADDSDIIYLTQKKIVLVTRTGKINLHRIPGNKRRLLQKMTVTPMGEIFVFTMDDQFNLYRLY